MVTELPTRKVVKTFKDAGWRRVRTEGSHSVYDCPCGQHSFSLPDGHKEISAGVVRKATKALAGCEGMRS
jgi:predicted RNA binding protein YcfA (HicA-like mRNA interferase family)